MTPAGGRRLATRVAVAMLLIASIGSLLLALTVYFMNEGLEDVVLQRQVRSELASVLAEQGATGPDGPKTVSRSYIGRDDPDLPDELATLAPGDYHSVQLDGRRYQILITDRGGSRYYIAYDITEWERRERWLILVLVAGVLIVTTGSVLVGRWASRQILEPVTRLAERVKSLQPDERDVHLAAEFEGAEVADIAEAFDRYLVRVNGFVEREQLFTSAASHELRTPLTVMQGAADVLAAQPGLSDVEARAVERIRRASRQMREFIDALLIVSRERDAGAPPPATCDLGNVVDQVVEDIGRIHAADRPDIRLTRDENVLVAAPASMPAIVVGNLLRNAVENGEGRPVHIDLRQDRLTITNAGAGIASSDLPRVFDRRYTTKADGGMGLFLASRICEQLEWDLSIESDPGVRTTVVLTFDRRERMPA
ncbi:MAG: HAMP domain-containing sensor histidine kinase [Gammaproteobacteria bacterium]